MKIMFVGDLHANHKRLQKLNEFGKRTGIDKAVGLGDFGYDFTDGFCSLVEQADFPWYFLDGNHDNHDILPHDADNFVELFPNMFYIPRGHFWNWGDYLFAGLGGAHSIDWRDRVMGESMWLKEMIEESDVDRLKKKSGVWSVDVFLSHDAPLWVPLHEIVPDFIKDDPNTIHNRTLLTEAIETVKPQRVIHGHYHTRYTVTIGCTQVDGLSSSEVGHWDSQVLFLEV